MARNGEAMEGSATLSNNPDLVITAIGILSAVGHDAATVCASIRAGLRRAGPVTHFSVLDAETQEIMPITGAPIQSITDGYSTLGRWLLMAQRAFKDLVNFGSLPGPDDASFWQKTGMILITPVLDDERFLFTLHCNAAVIGDTYVGPLLSALGHPITPQHVQVLPEGSTGSLRAVILADHYMINHGLERLFVLASDSYLDGVSLLWLEDQNRLKTGERHAGLIPGEAAAAFLVERRMAAQGRGTRVLANITAVSIDKEENSYLFGKPNHGRALGRTISNALAQANLGKPFGGDLIIDLNGEAWRAYDFGAAITQVPRELLGDYSLSTPAVSLGDTGAASAAIGLAVGVRAFQRGYARSNHTAILCSTVSGSSGTIIISSEG